MTSSYPPPDSPHISQLAPYCDTNVFCGPYPFRHLPCETAPQLRTFLQEAGITSAILTPFSALFYQRSWEALQVWLSDFRHDDHIRFWHVVNPLFPGWQSDLKKAARNSQVAGVRLFPRYHGYGVFSHELADTLAQCVEEALPVQLTARLLDDRLHPRMLRVDPPLDLQEIAGLLKHRADVSWILNAFSMHELRGLQSAIMESDTTLVDIGLSKPFEPWWDDLVELFPSSRMILGSGAPLYYHLGTRLSLQQSTPNGNDLHRVLNSNAESLLTRKGFPSLRT